MSKKMRIDIPLKVILPLSLSNQSSVLSHFLTASLPNNFHATRCVANTPIHRSIYIYICIFKKMDDFYSANDGIYKGIRIAMSENVQ